MIDAGVDGAQMAYLVCILDETGEWAVENHEVLYSLKDASETAAACVAEGCVGIRIIEVCMDRGGLK